MSKIARVVISVVVLVSVVAAIRLATAENTNASVESVLKQIDELGSKYPVFKGPEGSIWKSDMPKQLVKDDDAIQAIMTFAAASNSNFDALSDALLKKLDDLSSQYNAETVIDDSVAKKTLWYQDEYPGAGQPLYSYLLLQMAEQRQTNAFTAKCLTAILNAQSNISSFWKNVEIKNHPEETERINKESPVSGDYITTTSGDICWCLDNFLKELYNSDTYTAPTPTYTVLQEYWFWRTTALEKSRSKDNLDVRNLPEVKAYVKRLISTLE